MRMSFNFGIRAVCLVAAVAMVFSSVAQADLVTVVNWTNGEKTGGNLDLFGTRVTENYDSNGDSVLDSRRTIRAFNETTRLSPFTSSPAGETRVFYGGFEAGWIGATSGNPLERAQIRNVASDPFTVVAAANASAPSMVHGATVWLAADFLNLDPLLPNMELGIGTTMTLSFSADGVAPIHRFLVKQSDQYYVSQVTYAPGTHTLTNPSGNSNWAVYDPASDLNFDQGGAVFTSQTFNDIQAVGFYYELDASTNNQRVGARVTQFSVVANRTVAIPEPTSMALLGVAMLGGLLGRRRRD